MDILLVAQIICFSFSSDSFYLSEYRKKTVCQNSKTLAIESNKNKIDPYLFASLIYVESAWKKTVVSSANACGLTQVIPKYTGKITRKYTCKQLKDPATSIRAGTKILRWWIDWHTKNQPKRKYTQEEILNRALCSYNAGFRCGPDRRPIRGGMRYARKVLKVKRDILIMREHFLTQKN